MARPPATKNISKGSRFKLYEGRNEKDIHIRLTKDMMMNKNYLKLSSAAKEVYSYMKLWACGQDVVKYSISMAKDYMSEPTFLKAKKQLIEKGFIEHSNYFSARDKRETAIYRFIDKWLNT